MARLFFSCIFLCISFFSYAQHIKLVSTDPANGSELETFQSITLRFDLSEIYAKYPDISKEVWGIYADWTTATAATLYKDGVAVASKGFSLSPSSKRGEKGTESFVLTFDAPVQLDADETYSLIMKGDECLYPYCSGQGLRTADFKTLSLEGDIIITLYGPKTGSAGLTLESYSPAPSSLRQMDVLSLSFNEDVTVVDGAKAYIYENDDEVAQSVSMSVNAGNASVVDVDFGGEKLYTTHNYSIKIPEGSIFSKSDNSSYKAINIVGYTGANYHYLSLTSATPADKSEIAYLTNVEINFEFPEGYNLGYHSKDCKMYLYKEGTEEPIGEYVTDYNSVATGLIANIAKYDLEAGATYRVVFPEGQIVPGEIGQALSQYDLKETSNPEIVLTYTTPATLEPLHRVEGLTGSVESDGSIKVIVPSYDFNGNVMTVYPVEGAAGVTKKTETVTGGGGTAEKVSWFITCPLYDTTGSTQVKVGDIEMEFTPNPYSDSEIWLVGKSTQDLYAGRTYSLTVPAGTLAPKGMEDVASLVSNEDIALQLEGTTDPNALVISGGIAEGKELTELGVVAYYAEGAVTAADGAVVKLTQGETVVKEVPVVVATASGNTMLIADFCDESHAPLALEESAAYTLVLPQGSLLGSDGIMTNAEKTTALTGATAVTEPEMVSVTLTVGDNASSVAEAVMGKPYTVTVTLEADWTVETLTVGGTDVTSEMSNGSYTIAELTGDTEIIATLSYTGELTFADVSTGIASVEGTSIKAYSEDGEIVVEGLQSGDIVTVYTVGGMRLAAHEATRDSIRIAAPTGATYIVKVNGHAIKLAH